MGKGRCFTKQFSFVLKININSDSESVKKSVQNYERCCSLIAS